MWTLSYPQMPQTLLLLPAEMKILKNLKPFENQKSVGSWLVTNSPQIQKILNKLELNIKVFLDHKEGLMFNLEKRLKSKKKRKEKTLEGMLNCFKIRGPSVKWGCQVVVWLWSTMTARTRVGCPMMLSCPNFTSNMNFGVNENM